MPIFVLWSAWPIAGAARASFACRPAAAVDALAAIASRSLRHRRGSNCRSAVRSPHALGPTPVPKSKPRSWGRYRRVESLLFDHPGIRAEFVSEKKFRIAVGADVPAGSYDVYLVGRFGVSNPRLFGVSRGLQDVAEANDNRTLEKAQQIEVNSAVNGTINGAAEDYFRFAARKGQRIVIDCLAQRLDSDLDGTLALFASSGQSLATSGDYYGADP